MMMLKYDDDDDDALCTYSKMLSVVVAVIPKYWP